MIQRISLSLENAMLHASHTDFSNPDQSFALPATPHSFAASSGAITVSAVQSVPLHESVAGPQLYSGADMAVAAIALVGAWMVMLGLALLARHLRQAELPLAHQHQ